MIQVTPQMRILLAVEPADFRKGIDGLACLCRVTLRQDPFSGYVFVFGNRRRKAIKILVYDGQGFWLCQKRLSKGRFPWWPQSRSEATGDAGGPSTGGSAVGWRPDGGQGCSGLASGGRRAVSQQVPGIGSVLPRNR